MKIRAWLAPLSLAASMFLPQLAHAATPAAATNPLTKCDRAQNDESAPPQSGDRGDEGRWGGERRGARFHRHDRFGGRGRGEARWGRRGARFDGNPRFQRDPRFEGGPQFQGDPRFQGNDGHRETQGDPDGRGDRGDYGQE